MALILSFACTAIAGREAELEQRLGALVERMRKEEPDLLAMHWGRTEKPGEFALVEIFRDYAALEFHRASPAEKELGPGIGELTQPKTYKFIFHEL